MSKGKKSRAMEDTPEEGSGSAAESGDAVEIEIETQDEMEDSSELEGNNEGETSTEDTIEALGEEIESLKDQLLRKQADFENFRKRMVRDREDAISFANTNLLLDLVDVIDNFERAIKSSEDAKDFQAFHDGVILIEKQFTSMLDSKYGLKRFESENEEFDPEKHEAIAAVESEDTDTQTVIDDFQKGYMLHDRVLRPAKVRVVIPATVQKAEDNQAEDESKSEPEATDSEEDE